MATIKIDDSILDEVKQLANKVESYEDAVVSGMAAVRQSLIVLEGQSYEKLAKKLKQKMDSQVQLVAECRVFCELMQQYLEEMVQTEQSISFD